MLIDHVASEIRQKYDGAVCVLLGSVTKWNYSCTLEINLTHFAAAMLPPL